MWTVATTGYFPLVVSRIRPGLIGSCVWRTPVAWLTAFAMAASGGTMPGSPTPRTPNGCSGFGVSTMIVPIKATPMRQRNAALRVLLDRMFADRELDARFVPTAAGGVAAQWVLAPGADANRRLLYIHGGAFTLGSQRVSEATGLITPLAFGWLAWVLLAGIWTLTLVKTIAGVASGKLFQPHP